MKVVKYLVGGFFALIALVLFGLLFALYRSMQGKTKIDGTYYVPKDGSRLFRVNPKLYDFSVDPKMYDFSVKEPDTDAKNKNFGIDLEKAVELHVPNRFRMGTGSMFPEENLGMDSGYEPEQDS